MSFGYVLATTCGLELPHLPLVVLFRQVYG
jgi:hypothetical protein